MNPLKYAQMMKYLTRAKKADPSLPDVFPASKAPIPAKTQNVQETEAVNQFMLRNPRVEKAGGGRIGFENAGLVKKLYSQIKPYEGATKIGVSTKKDRGPEKKFMKAFEEYRDKKHGGVFKAAAEALGFKRERIKGVFDRVRLTETGTRAGGTGLGKGSKIQTTVPVPKNVTKFTEATTLAKKNKNYFKDKIKKLDNKKFYTNKDIANILGIDVTDKNSLDYLTQTLRKLNVKTNPRTPQQNLFQLGDAVTKLTKGVEKKLVKGDVKANTTRKISDAKLDPELTQFLENFKSRVRSLSKDANVYVPGAVEDVGHPLSIKITGKYPNLVKDSNINKINTLIFQDPTINRTLFEATGYESKHDKLLKQLNNLVGKKLNNKDLVKLNEIKMSLNNLHSKVINDVKNLSKTNSYFKGQEQRIPKIDINIPKVGETFKSKNLFVDMTNVNPAFKVGLVEDIAPGAKLFTDLSLKEKELYKQNILDQTKFNTEKFYVKAGFPKEDVQRLKETLDFGTDLKTGIGESRLKPPSGSGAVTLGALDLPSMFRKLSPATRKLVSGSGGLILPEVIFYQLDKKNRMSKGQSEKEAAAGALESGTLGLYENKAYMEELKKVAESMGIDSSSFDSAYQLNILSKSYNQNSDNYEKDYMQLLEIGEEQRADNLKKNFDRYTKETQNNYKLLTNSIADNVMNTVGASPLIMKEGRENITQEQFEKPFYDIQDTAIEKLKQEKIKAYPIQSRQVDTAAGNIGEGFYQAFDSLTQGAKNLLQGRIIPFGPNRLRPLESEREKEDRYLKDMSGQELYRYNKDFRNFTIDQPITSGDMENLQYEQPGVFFAGGGIAKLAGVSSGVAPTSGPNPQGLLSLKNRVRNY